jgi:hypothetical protein
LSHPLISIYNILEIVTDLFEKFRKNKTVGAIVTFSGEFAPNGLLSHANSSLADEKSGKVSSGASSHFDGVVVI